MRLYCYSNFTSGLPDLYHQRSAKMSNAGFFTLLSVICFLFSRDFYYRSKEFDFDLSLRKYATIWFGFALIFLAMVLLSEEVSDKILHISRYIFGLAIFGFGSYAGFAGARAEWRGPNKSLFPYFLSLGSLIIFCIIFNNMLSLL